MAPASPAWLAPTKPARGPRRACSAVPASSRARRMPPHTRALSVRQTRTPCPPVTTASCVPQSRAPMQAVGALRTVRAMQDGLGPTRRSVLAAWPARTKSAVEPRCANCVHLASFPVPPLPRRTRALTALQTRTRSTAVHGANSVQQIRNRLSQVRASVHAGVTPGLNQATQRACPVRRTHFDITPTLLHACGVILENSRPSGVCRQTVATFAPRDGTRKVLCSRL